MIRYAFADEKLLPIKNAARADPQRIGEELDHLRRMNGGQLKTEDAVAAAKDRSSAMHRHLEWDDAAAGHQHRLEQMRTLIRSIVRLEGEEEIREIPAFVSIKAATGGPRSYRGTEEILSSAHLRTALLKQAEADLVAIQKRYNKFELLVRAVDEPIRVAQQLIRRETGEEH
jgi:hypothetical protein